MSGSGLLEALAGVVGAKHVVTDAQALAPHLVEPRGTYQGAARALVAPGNVEEVSAAVKLCAAQGVGIVPQGGNTGLVGGQIPDASGAQIILSTARLNRVREVDPVNDVMTAEAGVTLGAAQAAADSAERLFPLSLASEGSCTIGGNLSTNAGGVHVLAFGNARELTRGVEVVLADGRIVNGLSKLRKDNTGYGLKDLFVGAEGTLGIITAASLRLFPKPRARATAFIGLRRPDDAVAMLGRALELTAFELIPRIGMDFLLRHIPRTRDPLAGAHAWYVLMEVSSPARDALDEPVTAFLGAMLEAGLAQDAALAASLEQRAEFWRLRETLPDSQRPEGLSVKHDVSVAVAAIPRLIEEVNAALAVKFPGVRPFPFGHVGDGNVHFNVSQPMGGDATAFRAQFGAIHDIVYDVVARLGGSISAEHGIGQEKRALLAKLKDPASLDVMRTIKAALDPKGIMNPGKVL